MEQLNQAAYDNAQNIILKIQADTQAQVAAILAKAFKDAEKINKDALAQVDSLRQAALEKAALTSDKFKNKIFSTLNLEQARIELKEKECLAGEIVARIKAKAKEFRNDSGYWSLLLEFILEGVVVIGRNQLEIIYSYLDQPILTNPEFVRQMKERCAAEGEINFIFTADSFKDIGVIVQSQDKRLVFDNTFNARFKRFYQDILSDLFKE